jgi:nucleotide-binding universal stress UspA family protein
MNAQTRKLVLKVKPYRVLLPLSNLTEAKLLIPLAETIARPRGGQVMIATVMNVPQDKVLSEAAAEVSRFREAVGSILPEEMFYTLSKTIVGVRDEIWDSIWDLIVQERIDLLIIAWETPEFKETALGSPMHPRLAQPPCDVLILRPSIEMLTEDGWQRVRRILLPIRGGPHGALALRVASALAEKVEASITLLHVATSESLQAEENVLSLYGPAIRGLEHLNRTLIVVDDVLPAIIQEAAHHQVLVMGAPTPEDRLESWSSPLLDRIVEETNTTLLFVKGKYLPTTRREAQRIAPEQPKAERFIYTPYTRDRPIAVVVDRWFAENTFHSREFADLNRLLMLKKAQQLTISLALPALNEEETVGNVIQTIKTALMEEVPLLDEIVLIDSDSTDRTRQIAQELGVPVYLHREILPQYGSYCGKGEALWKSLYVLSGDIIAWVDTDIKNIHPRFVYGILGPLLNDPKIQYVKGFYRRPLQEGEKIVAGGGGRVTELTARPFINLFFPELSGLIQPLSGEYAGRRYALERLPFFTGYGVETGLLIDLLDQFGLYAIAQVDLLERIHHNQPLPSLSKMSFAIMQVVFSRLEKRHRIRMLDKANLTMNLIRYQPKNRYYLETEEIVEHERPPMIAIPEYRQLRGLPPTDTDLSAS